MEGPTRASCSWQSSQQLDRQIFTSEVFLLSIAAATELLFFSSRFVSFAVFSSYFFLFAASFFRAGQPPQRAVVFSLNPKHI